MESVLIWRFDYGKYTKMRHLLVGHSMLLLSNWYKQRLKSNTVNSSFSHEIANLSVEVTMYIQKYELLLNINGCSNKTSKGDMYATTILYRQLLEILSQFSFLLTYVAVRVFYALSVVGF